jgi:hypothetical protein
MCSPAQHPVQVSLGNLVALWLCDIAHLMEAIQQGLCLISCMTLDNAPSSLHSPSPLLAGRVPRTAMTCGRTLLIIVMTMSSAAASTTRNALAQTTCLIPLPSLRYAHLTPLLIPQPTSLGCSTLSTCL